jgi:hypothetical protein
MRNSLCVQKRQRCYVVLSHIHHVRRCLLVPLKLLFLTAIGFLDPRYVLLPPLRPSSTIPQTVENKIAIHFATRFSQTVNTVRQYLKRENITQWARVQKLAGGDLMYASEMFIQTEDRRDATYVRVCLHFESSVLN